MFLSLTSLQLPYQILQAPAWLPWRWRRPFAARPGVGNHHFWQGCSYTHSMSMIAIKRGRFCEFASKIPSFSRNPFSEGRMIRSPTKDWIEMLPLHDIGWLCNRAAPPTVASFISFPALQTALLDHCRDEFRWIFVYLLQSLDGFCLLMIMMMDIYNQHMDRRFPKTGYP